MATPRATPIVLQSDGKALFDIHKRPIDEETQNGDNHTLDVTVLSHIPVLTFRFVNTDISMSTMEAEIYCLWYTVIQGAKFWQTENPKHDTVVRYIISARERGTLTRPLETPVADENGAITSLVSRHKVTACSDGALFWSGLPLLGPSLLCEWKHSYYQPDYSDIQRGNMASFIGRLLSVGIYNGAAVCALSLFRETLETTRPLILASADNAANNSADLEAGDKILSVEKLLHVLLELLAYAETSIVNLSNTTEKLPDSILSLEDSGLGELAIQSGIVSSGFSVERWRFWMQRLGELELEEDKGLARSALYCRRNMKVTSESICGVLSSMPTYDIHPDYEFDVE